MDLANRLKMPSFIKTTINRINYIYDIIFRAEEWNFGIIDKPIHRIFDTNFLNEINWYKRPKRGYFYADPFGYEKDGKLYIMFEEFSYFSKNASISVVEVKEGKTFGQKETSIREDFHLSYPYIIEHNNEIYCVPETTQANEVSIYKLVEGYNRWEKIGTLIEDFDACDSTIFQYKGFWWLMCTSQEKGSNLYLFIYYSKDLFGPWHAHPKNPVKKDISSTRPGGTPFVYEGNLYRPAQDSSKTYGGRIIINKVLELTPTEFKEVKVKAVGPPKDAYIKGLHTLSSIGNFTIIDAKRFYFLPENIKLIIKKIKKKFKMK